MAGKRGATGGAGGRKRGFDPRSPRRIAAWQRRFQTRTTRSFLPELERATTKDQRRALLYAAGRKVLDALKLPKRKREEARRWHGRWFAARLAQESARHGKHITGKAGIQHLENMAAFLRSELRRGTEPPRSAHLGHLLEETGRLLSLARENPRRTTEAYAYWAGEAQEYALAQLQQLLGLRRYTVFRRSLHNLQVRAEVTRR